MAELDSKKLGLVRILQILQKYTDGKPGNALTQNEISDILVNEYGIELERKAIGRNIDLLEKSGDFGIVSDKKKGTFVSERLFMDSELRMLIDSVFTSRYITRRHANDIIERLSKLSGPSFQAYVESMYSADSVSRTDNQGLFLNIEEIGRAIKYNKQIEFDYNKYGKDKKLHHSSHHKASPYLLIVKNQKYYMMAYHEYFGNMIYYRLDHITNVKVLDDAATPVKKVKGYEKGIDYKQITSYMPYMYSDDPVMVTFTASESIIDQMVEQFGQDFNIKELKDIENGKVRIVIKVSPKAMEYFAMQYLNELEIEAPKSLREQIKKNLEEGLEKYK